MNSSPKPAVWILGICILAGAIYAGYLLRQPAKVRAQDAANTAVVAQPADPNQTPTGTNPPQPTSSAPPNTGAATPPTNATTTVAGAPTNNVPPSSAVAAVPATPVAPMPPPNILPLQPAALDSDNTNEVQLSFQNAQVDIIVQWLAKHTGKSVVKHPRVQCQLTIISSTKLTPREAVNLVYRALALEGFNVVETSKSILIVPDGQEPKMTPELIKGTANDIPEGRQRLIRFFELKKVEPSEIRDKVKTVLTDKATIEVNERANQLIITDYTENIRLASELIQALDVESSSDIAIEFFKLKFADAEEITSLLTQILNAQPASPSSGSRSSSGSSSSRPPSPDGSSPPGMPSPGPSSPPGASASPPAGSGVKIWPDKSANQLIISAPKSRMQEIRDLLATLDVEQSEDITMRVIPLQNVSAEDLVKEIAPLYQRVTSRSPKDKVEVTANTRSNSLIIYSSAENYREVQKLVEALDREDAQERVMRAFPLKNADAEDVAKQLETLNEGSQNQGRFPYYIFSSGGSSSQQNKKPTFVADRRRNAVIVQGPPAQMENIEKLIESLDAPTADGTLAPKIFRMKYVSAVDIEEVLNELFLQQQQQRNYWDPFMGGYYGSGSSSSSRDSTGGKLYGKVRITSEPYSNSLIVTSSSPEGLAAVEEMIKEIDSPSQAGETTMRITLNFARANQLASSLNVLFARGGSPFLRQQGNQPQQAQQPNPQQQNTSIQNRFTLEEEAKEDPYYSWLGGQQESPFGRTGDRNAQRPVSDLIGRVRIVPDRRSNSLLVTANLHFFPQIIKLVKELDEPTPQVLIEAKIIEVASDFRDKLGVRWSPDGSTFTGEDLDDSILVKGRGQYSEVFSGSRAADALRTGVLDSSVDLNILIQFLRKNLNAKVLAEPQLNIRENELGKLFVGAQVPTLTGSNITPEGTRNDTFNYRDVGVILEVIPHINNSDEVALKINAESSSIRPGETLFGAFILDTRNFKTDLAVKDGETVVLGGIIQREQSNIDRKVPGLGSIPGLGYLFRKKDKTAREVELMVFLRPRITRTPAEAAQLLRDVQNKAPLIRAWDEEKPALSPDQDPQPVPQKN